MTKSPNQRKAWLRFLPLALAVAVFYVMVPLRWSMGTLSHDQAVAHADAQNTTKDNQSIADAEQVLHHKAQWTATLHHLSAAIPATRKFSTLVDQLTSLAVATGVSWTSGSIGAPKTTSGARTPSPTAPQAVVVPISMLVTGSAGAIAVFLRGMQALPRLVVVQTAALSSPTSGTEAAAVTATAYLVR